MASSEAGQYQSFIERFTFRDDGALTIPKTSDGLSLGRETCYKLCVDVVIESVTKPQYRNLRTTPYHGFYGYATLVKRDCLDEKIELEFGRNRIFEQRISEAFTAWNNLSFYLNTEKRFLEVLANSLRLGEPPESLINICDIEAFPFNFSETDLREVYVKCEPSTQFFIELSWVSPKAFTDNCGVSHEGKSNEPDDPKKDDGLPANGSQPKKNSASNPWNNNKPANGIPPDSPYFNDKIGSVDDVNPDNFLNDPNLPIIYWMKSVSRIKRSTHEGGCSVTKVGTAHLQLLNGDITFEQRPKASFPPTPTGCGDTTSRLQQIRLSGGEWFDWDFADSDSPLILTKESGTVLPPDSVEFE